jgi:hypothetical protein
MPINGGGLEGVFFNHRPTYGAPCHYADTPNGFVRLLTTGEIEQWENGKFVLANSEKIVDELGNTYNLPLFSRPTKYGPAVYRATDGQISNFRGAAITIRGAMMLDVFITGGQLCSRHGPCIHMQMGGAKMQAYALDGLIHHDFRYAIRYVDTDNDVEIKVFMRRGRISYFSKDVPSVVIRKGGVTRKYWVFNDEIYVPSAQGRLCLGSLDHKWYNSTTEKNGTVKHKSYVSCGENAKTIDVNCEMFDFLRECKVPLPYMSFNVVKHCVVGPYNGVDYAINGVVYTSGYASYRGGIAKSLWEKDVQRIYGKGMESIRMAQAETLPPPTQVPRFLVQQAQPTWLPKKTASTDFKFCWLMISAGQTPWSAPEQIKWGGVKRTIESVNDGLPNGNPVEFKYEE